MKNTKLKQVSTRIIDEESEKLSPLQSEYKDFFKKMMHKYGINKLDELDGDKEKEFYSNVNKYWDNGKGEVKGWEDKVSISESCGKPRKKAKRFKRMQSIDEDTMPNRQGQLHMIDSINFNSMSDTDITQIYNIVNAHLSK